MGVEAEKTSADSDVEKKISETKKRGSATAYYDADFAWEDVAAKRRNKCLGDEAPPMLDSEEVAQRTKEDNLAQSWEAFYAAHANGFFKERSYLAKAFPALVDLSEAQPRVLGELGCGTGAAVLPLLKEIPQLSVQVVDVSPSAIDSLKLLANSKELASRVEASVCDIVQDPLPMKLASLDFGLMIFTLSAISPCHHAEVLRKLCVSLRLGGHLCFRDYGLFDMVQTRCKTRLGENWYIKQDGVQCFFFSIEYFQSLLKSLEPEVCMAVQECKYVTVRNINRKTGQNIDRVFLNALFQRIDKEEQS